MKLKFTLFLALLTFSLAVDLNHITQVSLRVDEINQDYSMQSLLQSLLQVTQINEFVQVMQILDRIKGEFEGLRGRTQNNLDNENTRYESDRQALQDTIDTLNGQITQADQDLADAEVNRDSIRSSIKSAEDAIQEARDGRDAEVARREASKAVHDESVRNINAAISACDQALGYLKELEEQDLAQVGFSFLETQRQKVHAKLLHIQEKMAKIHTKNPIAPFIKALVEVAQDSVNADIIEKIILMIQDLKGSLQHEKTVVDKDDEEDENTSKNVIANYDSTIAAQQIALSNNQDALRTINSRIDTLTQQKESYEKSLGVANQNLEDLNNSHAQRVDSLTNQISRLRTDVNTLDQALAYLRSQTI